MIGLYCLGSCIFRYSQDSLMNHFKILKEFQGCLSIQLSKIYIAQTQYLSGVLSLICYRLPRRLVYNIIRYTHCQQLFSKSFKKVQFFCFLHFSLLFTSKSISQAACLLGSCVCLPLDFFVPSLSSNIQYVTSRLLFLDFLVPSLHFNVQSAISWLLFWTSTCLPSALMSNPPRRSFHFGLPYAFSPH